MPSKVRLDELMVFRGLMDDAEQAKRYVLAGQVLVDGNRVSSSAIKVKRDCDIQVTGMTSFVSRGGHKLQKALEVFPVDVAGTSCLDCGASTGGFTDCLLQHGAASVCAVDKGYGDFAWKLRQDPRVTLFERSDVRDFPAQEAGAPFDVAVSDMSFIRLRNWIDSLVPLLKEGGAFITLVKPQFEALREEVGQGGVVYEKDVHARVLYDTCRCVEEKGFAVAGLDFSPIKGPAGNIEFLLYALKGAKVSESATETLGGAELKDTVERVVQAAHDTLNERMEP